MAGSVDTTQALLDWSGGDESAADRLLPIVYEELRALATWHLRGERRDHTLQPTALVHEAYVRLVQPHRVGVTDRVHFFALASKAIRQILVDHARSRNAEKRGAGAPGLALDEAQDVQAPGDIEYLALHEALDKLCALDERQARVVELRFFGGLTVEEAAEVLGVSARTIKGDWQMARAWLRARLEDGCENSCP